MAKKFWKKIIAPAMACLMAVSVSAPMISCDSGKTTGQQSSQNSCTFVYDVNYEGGRNRTITLSAGKPASYYKASRFGYILEGWFCEKECKTPYDFSSAVNKNTTVYALWTDESTIVYHNVVFDYGEGVTTTEKCRDGRSIPAYSVRESQRFGYEITGWYADANFMQKFEIGVDPVTSDITLYAKYEKAKGIEFNENGDFVFENVEITLSFKDNHETSKKKWVQTLLDEFNQAYEGRIHVSMAESGKNGTVVFNQTSTLNAKKDELYPIEDVLKTVGKDFDEGEYYENWINDCYVDDVLYSMPIGSFVPVIGYNRKLMDEYTQKYTNGELPSDHESFMTLLNGVHSEKSSDPEWVSTVSMSLSWDMKEVASNSFYLQNNMPLYSKGENGKFANQWLQLIDGKQEVPQNVLNSVNWFRDMFLKDGSIGKLTGTAWQTGNKGVDWSWVGKGNSFMGIMGTANMNSIFGWRTDQTEKTLWTKTVGAMPISYFFATEGDSEAAQRIYVQNYSLAIPKSAESDTSEVAAAAIFADFASKYSEDMTESYLYPANKVAQYNAFNGISRHWCVDYLLLECGDPNNFYTYPGAFYEYNVTATVQSNFLMKSLPWIDDDADDERVKTEIRTFINNINKEMGV